MRDITIWAVNPGKSAEAESLFLNKSIISPGLAKMPDLSYGGDREAFKIRYQQSYPSTKASDLPLMAAQIFRFVQEIGDGDFVVYPAKLSRKVHIGQFTGNYTYRPSVNASYPHQRPVRWLKEFSRAQFSQGALFELGSTMMVFKIKAYADEFRAALERKLATPDEKILPSAPVATEEMEEQARDFVARQLSQCSRSSFENFAVHLLGKMGYRTRLLSSGETSSDYIANKGLLGLEPPTVKVHIRLDGKFSEQDLAGFTRSIADHERGLVISSAALPIAVWQAAKAYPNLQLIDGASLADLVFNLYDHLDLQQQQLVPLKRIFVPDLAAHEAAD